jgi:hypothetical protein
MVDLILAALQVVELDQIEGGDGSAETAVALLKKGYGLL